MKRAKLKLKRSLGLFEATCYGVGVILGAGIYALIGTGAGIAGNLLWLSFIIAAMIAIFTGLSYAEMSSICPKEAAEYNYTRMAFKRKNLSFIVGWIMILSTVIAAAAVSLGFANYFSHIFGTPIIPTAIGLIAILSIINFSGIKESAKLNIIETSIEFFGLLLIIVLGFSFIGNSHINYFEMPNNTFVLGGLISSIMVIFFAYIGFEGIVNISEETKNPTKVIPKALILSIIISTVLYILVSITAISVLGWQQLSQSQAPLADVAKAAYPGFNFSLLLSLIALFATSNTVLINLIIGSRVFYGMSNDHSLPKILSKIHRKRKTPYIAVFIVMILTMLVVSIGNLKTVAVLTDVAIFIVYFAVNISLIWLRFKEPEIERPFRSPVNIGKLPLLAVIGAISCIAMILHVEAILLVGEMIIIIIGYLLYLVYQRFRTIKRG